MQSKERTYFTFLFYWVEYLSSFTSEWLKFSNERGLEKKIGLKKRGAANERLNNMCFQILVLYMFLTA